MKMGKKKPQLPLETRARIVALYKNGKSQVKIAKTLKCSRRTVQTTLQRFKTTGSLQNKPGSGRKRKTSQRIDRKIVRMSLANRKKTSSQLSADLLQEENVSISSSTVRRRLMQANLKGCKARKKPLLSNKNIKNRLEWAKTHKNWTLDDWDKILWSDETNIEIFGSPGAVYVRRRPGEAYKPECVVPTVKFGGGSVMVWGCMSARGVGELFICEGRMTSATYTTMLDHVLQPSIEKLYAAEEHEVVWFQQDKAPCHTSHHTTNFFLNKNINVLPWPAQSPDLNPIEHLWKILKTNIAKKNPSSKRQLVSIIKAEWELITPEICKKLVYSMPNRISDVIKAKGSSTRY